MKLVTVVKYWFPVLIWIAFVFWMSTGSFSPQKTSSVLEPLLRLLFPSILQMELEFVHALTRKLAHIVEFFIGGLLVFRAFRSGTVEPLAWRWAILSAMTVALVGAGDELHQHLASTRNASIVDVGIDAVGGTLAQVLAIIRFRRLRQQSDG